MNRLAQQLDDGIQETGKLLAQHLEVKARENCGWIDVEPVIEGDVFGMSAYERPPAFMRIFNVHLHLHIKLTWTSEPL